MIALSIAYNGIDASSTHNSCNGIVEMKLLSQKIRLRINIKNITTSHVLNEIISLFMHIIIDSLFFIQIILEDLKIGIFKFRCTSKLLHQFLSSLYFIGLINLYI